MAKRKKRERSTEETMLIDSFIMLVKRMGPRKAPSARNCGNALLHWVVKKESVRGVCGLVEWHMHTKRRKWEEDQDRGVERWLVYVEEWINENRAYISALILAGK